MTFADVPDGDVDGFVELGRGDFGGFDAGAQGEEAGGDFGGDLAVVHGATGRMMVGFAIGDKVAMWNGCENVSGFARGSG
jgi:hypothetical protein